MAGNKTKKRLSVAAVILSISVILSQSTFAFDAQANKKEQENLQKKAEQYEKTLEKTRDDISKKQAYAKALQGKIDTLSKQIKLSNEKIDELNKSIKKKQTQIDEKLAEIEDNMTELRGRLRTIYMAGDTSSLEIILGAKDFSDFIDKAELIGSISDYDDKLIKGLQSELSKISKEQKAMREEKSAVEKEKKSLESQKNEINKLSEENSELIAELQGVESATLDSIGENKESITALEEELKAYFEEQKKKAQSNSNKQNPKPNNNSSSSSNNNNNNSNNNSNNNPNNSSNNNSGNKEPSVSSGEYVWPCPGYYYLSSTYDENRGANNHGALDIAGGGIYGAEVVAARNGTVVSSYSGCTHDYGKSDSCGCGGGYVSYGDTVSAGQLIGRVGSTGYSSGPHLHFETKYSTIWDHSQRYNPLDEYPGLF